MYFTAALIIFAFMNIIFIMGLIKKDNSIVDIAWGLGFVTVSVATFIMGESHSINQLLVNLLIWIWGIRLAIHIFFRNKGKGEDYRYKNWRDNWKFFHLRAYFQIFMLQGTMMFIILLPVIFVNSKDTGSIGMTEIVATIIFLTGFLFEAIADYQLLRFKANTENKGKIITSGLWRFSRHPNYFGEALLWWGIAIFALSYPNSWFVLLSPVTITILVRFVSGVTMLEKKYKNNQEFQEYVRKTPPFIPIRFGSYR